MAQWHKRVTVIVTVVSWILTRWIKILSILVNFLSLIKRQSTALRSATRHPMLRDFSRKWGTEFFNTKIFNSYILKFVQTNLQTLEIKS